jgi:hypothetical protein
MSYNVFIHSTNNGSTDEIEEENKSPKALRKKSISMNDIDIRNKLFIRTHKKSNSCIFRRRDFFGNIINKENKQYKVTFRDLVTIKPLTEVVPVVKFRYSDTKIIESSNVDKVEMAKCECKCLIF